MSVIWKYELELKEKQAVSMPIGAEIIHIAAQFEKPCIWAIVDPYAEKEDRVIGILTTGGPHFNADVSHHCGSFFLNGGLFVGHVFESALGQTAAKGTAT